MSLGAKRAVRALGLMSGTSMDAIDAALIVTDGELILELGPSAEFPFAPEERALLREAMASARGVERRDDRSGVLAIAEELITRKHAVAAVEFLKRCALRPADIAVVGFHGQTMIHRPERGLTVQLGDGAALAKAIGAPVVYDFRANDVAAGGQGAPLAPVYHRALVNSGDHPRPVAVVNLGGVANMTWIGEDGAMLAFDTGPGNALIDDWALRHTGAPMDRDGALARRGVVNQAILEDMLRKPYFFAPPPKSLDRNAFDLAALDGLSPEDGAATLTALTAAALAHGAAQTPTPAKQWILIGGGARNPALVEVIRRTLPGDVALGEAVGWRSEAIEAQAFAFLAVRSLYGYPISFPGATGAPEPLTGGVLVRP
ncbi:MAG: anhydro-N-acetylmuramic acid kinase [Hyphomicrobiales bacterium]|nr:anhydro-N-acetylmuramic acid kinase [Hyphomicrobiales bacterium]